MVWWTQAGRQGAMRWCSNHAMLRPCHLDGLHARIMPLLAHLRFGKLRWMLLLVCMLFFGVLSFFFFSGSRLCKCSSAAGAGGSSPSGSEDIAFDLNCWQDGVFFSWREIALLRMLMKRWGAEGQHASLGLVPMQVKRCCQGGKYSQYGSFEIDDRL